MAVHHQWAFPFFSSFEIVLFNNGWICWFSVDGLMYNRIALFCRMKIGCVWICFVCVPPYLLTIGRVRKCEGAVQQSSIQYTETFESVGLWFYSALLLILIFWL